MSRLPQVWLAAVTLLIAVPVRAAEPLASKPPLARKNEIKLYVTAENAAHALRLLKLDGLPVIRRTVCFFDTADGTLRSNNLILRARQNDGEPGESTVKIRAGAEDAELTGKELAIQPEQDWTRADNPTLSRALDSGPLDSGLVPKVIAGEEAVVSLFSPRQRALVTARMKGLDWQSLKRYGPVKTEVWKEQIKLKGFSERVTVEIWHLQKDGRSLDVLEISAKAKAETEEQARAIAKDFFGAAKAAGLGEPAGQTKTASVLDFYKPGR